MSETSSKKLRDIVKKQFKDEIERQSKELVDKRFAEEIKKRDIAFWKLHRQMDITFLVACGLLVGNVVLFLMWWFKWEQRYILFLERY